jgi:hypothetical protein
MNWRLPENKTPSFALHELRILIPSGLAHVGVLQEVSGMRAIGSSWLNMQASTRACRAELGAPPTGSHSLGRLPTR